MLIDLEESALHCFTSFVLFVAVKIRGGTSLTRKTTIFLVWCRADKKPPKCEVQCFWKKMTLTVHLAIFHFPVAGMIQLTVASEDKFN